METEHNCHSVKHGPRSRQSAVTTCKSALSARKFSSYKRNLMCILMDQTLLCIGAFGLWFLFIFLFFDYVVCFSFFFLLRVLDKAEYSAFESTLNSPIVSYRIIE